LYTINAKEHKKVIPRQLLPGAAVVMTA